MAERQGFEPWTRVTPRNGFRDRPDQPLWHLSGIFGSYSIAKAGFIGYRIINY
jgi:hypothetical protein